MPTASFSENQYGNEIVSFILVMDSNGMLLSGVVHVTVWFKGEHI